MANISQRSKLINNKFLIDRVQSGPILEIYYFPRIREQGTDQETHEFWTQNKPCAENLQTSPHTYVRFKLRVKVFFLDKDPGQSHSFPDS
jgi:hypothetical protein